VARNAKKNKMMDERAEISSPEELCGSLPPLAMIPSEVELLEKLLFLEGFKLSELIDWNSVCEEYAPVVREQVRLMNMNPSEER
jgi:hypothetical protein